MLSKSSEEFLHNIKRIDLCMKKFLLAWDDVHDALTQFYKSHIDTEVTIFKVDEDGNESINES